LIPGQGDIMSILKQKKNWTRAASSMAVALLASTTMLAQAHAQQKVTQLVVGFTPGGPVDIVARTISEQLGKELNSQTIVVNKPGANGGIGAEFVARAAPDGSTLWLTSVGAVGINPSLYEKLGYDPVRDFAPVSLVVNNVALMVVGMGNPANTGAEFIANAQAKGEGATMASTGTGSVPHLVMEMLADATRAKLVHVPYKGAAPAITDTIPGHVGGFFVDIPGVINFIKAGKLKPIGVAATKRSPLFPEVRTFQEMGIAGVESANNWFGLFVARGVPAAEIERINAALRRTLSNVSVRARLVAAGTEPAPTTPAELALLLKNDTAKWGHVIRSKHIKPE
jgi:tripartite-type tricarboxylate transporter receptor subunit TctC